MNNTTFNSYDTAMAALELAIASLADHDIPHKRASRSRLAWMGNGGACVAEVIAPANGLGWHILCRMPISTAADMQLALSGSGVIAASAETGHGP